MERRHELVQLGDIDTGMQFVQLGNGQGLWMNKKFSDDKIGEEFNGKIDSVRGPPSAPIGFGVAALSNEGGAPYAAKKTVEEPARGIQHQPVILPAGEYKAEVAAPVPEDPMAAYRQEVGEKGVRAADATLNKLVAAGMTDTPKARFNNSILKDIPELDADKAKNAAIPADPNAGAPKAAEADPKKAKQQLDALAKKDPNPNAAPADPKTDPAASAKAANDMEAASAKKAEATDAKAAKVAPAAALAQSIYTTAEEDAMKAKIIEATKIDSVRGPSEGAPIGYGVHKLAVEGGNPYAAKQMYRAAEPIPGVQHQPVMLKEETAPVAAAAAPLSPEMEYRTKLAREGITADAANWDKLTAAGMTDTPKVRWSNSILDDVAAKDEAADKAKNAATPADPNAGAPAVAETDPKKAKQQLEAAAKKDPNPNAAPADPATDPAATAAAANKMEDAQSAKQNAAEAAKAKAPKAALAQSIYTTEEEDAMKAKIIEATKIESVKGPPGAPIGYGVHKLSVEGGNPYAAKQMYRAEAPANGVQHQPVMLPADFYRGEVAAPEKLSPELQYRKEMGEEGVRAADATLGKLVAAGMTDTPKVRFNNSILAPAANATKDAAPVNAATDKTVVALEAAAKAPAAAAAAPEAAAAAAPEAAAAAAPKAAALMQK